MIWIAPEPPRTPLLDDTPYRDSGFDWFVCGPFTTPVSAAVLTDNFLDPSHFPFVHAATFGSEDDGRPVVEVARDGWTFVQRTSRRTGAPQLDGNVEMHYRYTCAAPFVVELLLTGPSMGVNAIWSFVRPDADGTSTWWLVQAYDDLGHDPALIAAAADFQTRVGVEDLAILERMDDPVIALDLREEVHTKADLGTVEYRRLLRDVVGRAGHDLPLPEGART